MSDETVDAEAPPPPPKVDPESLALRARPATPIRFKKGAIVGLCAAASLAMIATT